MNRSSLESSQHSVNKTTYTNDLATWTEASFDLFINFKKIQSCLTQNAISGGTERLQSTYIGQCPREQMTVLFTTMERELDRLLKELEQLNRVSQMEHRMNHPRLIAQTATLNQLNQQAKDKLFLATLSAT